MSYFPAKIGTTSNNLCVCVVPDSQPIIFIVEELYQKKKRILAEAAKAPEERRRKTAKKGGTGRYYSSSRRLRGKKRGGTEVCSTAALCLGRYRVSVFQPGSSDLSIVLVYSIIGEASPPHTAQALRWFQRRTRAIMDKKGYNPRNRPI